MNIFTASEKTSQDWKRVRQEKLIKAKHRIEQMLDKEHSITAKEKGWRDWFFRPLSYVCRKIGIRANHVTVFGFFLVLLQIYYFSIGENVYGLLSAITAAFTDMIDGPIARFKYTKDGNDDVTAVGTFLDHFRDYFLTFSFCYFAFFYGGIVRPIETVLAIIIFLIYLGIFIGTIIKLRKFRVQNNNIENNMNGFLLPDMQTSFWGRAQFFLVISGTILLFFGYMTDTLFLILLSYVIFGIHIGINFRNLIEEYILT